MRMSLRLRYQGCVARDFSQIRRPSVVAPKLLTIQSPPPCGHDFYRKTSSNSPGDRRQNALISIERPGFHAGSKGDVRRAINGVQLPGSLNLGVPRARARGRSGPSFVFKSVPGRSRKRANDRLSSSPSKHNFLAATAAAIVVVAVDVGDGVDHHPSSIFQSAC